MSDEAARDASSAPATTDARLLEGNGVALVRERALASRVQRGLERLYRIEDVPEVTDFLTPAEDGEREALHVRATGDGIEMALRVPALDSGLDALCQIIEGVSHFVYLAERARVDRETTQLELEVQAEVDKYVVLATSVGDLDVWKSEALRARLYDQVAFCHAETTELGARYRLANTVAARFVRNVEREYVASRRFAALRDHLRRFFQMGQEDKLRAVRDA